MRGGIGWGEVMQGGIGWGNAMQGGWDRVGQRDVRWMG
jgi:hypothetical protein